MSTEDSNSSNTKDVIDAVSGLAKAIPVYDDAIRPAAKEIGKGLQTVAKTVNIALAPVTALVWGYDQIENYISNSVSEKLKKIPPENIITPNISVAGPTLEALRFAGHEENLREMYANLLATAMNSEVSDFAHPSFVEVVKQMAPKEAEFVTTLSNQENYPHILGIYHTSTTKFGLFNYKSSDTNEIEEFIIKLCKEIDINSKLAKMYLSNLLRLRILETYEEIETYEDWSNLSTEIIENANLSDSIGVEQRITINLRFSEFGKTFINVCVKESNSQPDTL